MSRAQDRAGRALLAAGAALGIVAGALAARTDTAATSLPPAAISLVDGRPILREDFTRALEGLASDRRDAPGEAERAHVLARLEDEELLAQHALASGLLQRDRAVRDAVLQAMVDAASAEAAARDGDEDELRAREEALRSYLAELRARARIRVVPEAVR
jgi:hypothetical protein